MVCFSCSGAKPRKRKPFGIPGRRKDKDTDSTWVKISTDTISATYFYFPSSKNKIICNHDVMLLYSRESTEVEAAVSIIFIKTTSFSLSSSLYFSFFMFKQAEAVEKVPGSCYSALYSAAWTCDSLHVLSVCSSLFVLKICSFIHSFISLWSRL